MQISARLIQSVVVIAIAALLLQGSRAEALPTATPTRTRTPTPTATSTPVCIYEIARDLSSPLTGMQAAAAPRPQVILQLEQSEVSGSAAIDPVLQTTAGAAANAVGVLDFDGLSYGGSPPDPNGAVGAFQFVQTTNYGLGIYSKATGQSQYTGALSDVFQGFRGDGGQCASDVLGDPIVLYDHMANQWIVTYIGGGGQGVYEQCFALSEGADARGRWYRYALGLRDLDDFPKVGIWPDAYYMSSKSSGTKSQCDAHGQPKFSAVLSAGYGHRWYLPV